ncbi:peptidase M23 [Bacillus mobilis]|uniref:peptidase M23 n=1 Tax=Bacillus TaxID=1386 RepID=UPI00224DC8F8|nr:MULTISPECIES: peptidase M23 [Bacillus cereus group]HDR4581925.1 peptidase M23 [Bacillus cereus]MCX3319420.1 peptidase M23 [Bacillus paranthracis]MDA1615814.1 peptidase M23 [Bacillus cereus group sp. TH204-1LC]MDA1744050.1 peptidase M23 [Bacillus cereus group sp. LD121LC]MDK7417095.1 peptidase M23 [Bacillus paranthracis]
MLLIIDEVLNTTNKRLAQIDEILLMNTNSTLKLIDMQIQLLNDVEEQTEDKQLLEQIYKQIERLKNNRVLLVLVTKYIVKNELNVQEKRVITNILKRD